MTVENHIFQVLYSLSEIGVLILFKVLFSLKIMREIGIFVYYEIYIFKKNQ